MRAFRDAFRDALGGLIEEVVVGAGPCGELRFPSYPEANGWRFPGVRARPASHDVAPLTRVCREPSAVSKAGMRALPGPSHGLQRPGHSGWLVTSGAALGLWVVM